MYGRATLTIRGEHCGCDGFELLVSIRVQDVAMLVRALPTGWCHAPRARHLHCIKSDGTKVTLRYASATGGAGTRFILDGENARGRNPNDVYIPLVHAARKLNLRCTLPRVDWYRQGGPGLRGEVLHVASVDEWVDSAQVPGDESMSAVQSGAGYTEYRSRKSYRRVVSRDGTERSLQDRWLLRVYNATDLDGVEYIRAEVQERIASRSAPDVLRCSMETYVVLRLTAEGISWDHIKRVDPEPDSARQVARALSLLATNVDGRLLGLVEELINELDPKGDELAGPRERLAVRRGVGV